MGFFSLSAGASVPVGNFASFNVDSPSSGMARLGNAFSVSAGYRFAGTVGFMGQYRQQTSPLEADALLALPYLEKAKNRSATAGQWMVTNFLAGPYFSLPINRFALDFRALAGWATAICPATRVEGSLGDIPLAMSTSRGQANAFSYGGGSTLSYRLGRCLAVQLSADYTTAMFQFPQIATTIQDGINSQTTLGNGQKTITTVNVSLGMAFLFGNRFRPF